MEQAEPHNAPIAKQTSIQLDELFQRIKEHDSEWLAKTLYERWVALLHDEDKHGQLRGVSTQTAIWPFDVTLPHLPDGLTVTEYVRFIRSYDWGSTALGPMSDWGLDLRRMVNMCLCDKRASALWVGQGHIGFYNEEYAMTIAGKRHPHMLGKSFREMWPEPGVAEYFEGMFEQGLRLGRSSKGDDQLFLLERNGACEEFWANFTIVPFADSAGGVFGNYNTCVDVTAAQVQARRLTTMLKLSQKTTSAQNAHDFWAHLISACDSNAYDLPFIAIYARHQETQQGASKTTGRAHSAPPPLSGHVDGHHPSWWTLAGTTGVVDEFTCLPQLLNSKSADKIFTPGFSSAVESGEPLVLTKKQSTFPPCLNGIARSRIRDKECDTLVLSPISPANREDTAGFIIIGTNPLITYNDGYKQFIEMLVRQCATSLASVMLIEEERERARLAAQLAAQDHIELSAQLAETKQEVVEHETRFRMMADLAPVAMFQLDESGKVLYANKSWMELTQHEPDAWEPKSWHENVHPDDVERVDAEWAKLTQGVPVSFEMRWKKPFSPEHVEYVSGELVEGTTWTIASAYAEKRPDGSVRGILGCLTDISRQKWIEGFQDRRVKELVELKRQQENFMDMTSHEARNPLSAIMLCAESLLIAFKEMSQTGSDKIILDKKALEMHLESADIIMACAQHQKRIIDDVLTLSKLDSGLLVICPVEIQPAKSIAQALKMFDGELHKHDIKLEFEIDRSYHDLQVDWVRQDPSRLLQVLINLVTNSIKFTQGSRVREIKVTLCAHSSRPSASLHGVSYIRDDWSTVRSSEEGNVFIGLEVIDTGRGITPEEMKKLFQKFQQASPKTHVEYGGSGLGLFISRQLTRMLGGAIGVASAGKGATFAFYMMAPKCTAPESLSDKVEIRRDSVQMSLPDSVAENVTQGRRASLNQEALELVNPVEEKKNNILVVEDNLVNQKVMRNQLERLQYKVAVANHGLEALDHIRKTRFCSQGGIPLDIVLMDIEMPVCNGLECAKRIRQMERDGTIREHIPIIGVTANARAEQQQAARDAGMDSVVTKPFRLLELSAELEKIAQQK